MAFVGTLPPGDNEDIYRIEIAQAGTVVADLWDIPPGTDYDLFVYNEQKQKIGESRQLGTEPEHIEVSVQPSKYYLRVYAFTGRSDQNYYLRWSLRKEPTPTPSPTATPTPIPGPPCNGDFEAGRFEPCWQHGGELARSVVEWLDVGEPNPVVQPPYAGRYSALLGDPSLGPGLPYQPNIPVGSAWIEQAIAVPNTTSPRLSFWYRIMSYDVARDAEGRWYDIFEVQINGQQVFWDGNQRVHSSQRRNDLGWRRGEVDLSRWRGQAVTMRFVNWNGYWPGPGAELYNTWTYLDEVQVQP